MKPSRLLMELFLLVSILSFTQTTILMSQQSPSQMAMSKGLLVSIEPPWDTIDSGVAECLVDALRYAEERGYVLIYKVNSYGGYLDPAFNIGDALYDSNIPTIAYVENKALSAGTLIILPADVIVLRKGSIIGAMKPVVVNPLTGEVTFVNESKIIEPIVAKATLFADRKGRNTTLVREFIVDAIVVNSSTAVSKGLADLQVNEYGELFEMTRGLVIVKENRAYRLELDPSSIEIYSCSVRSRFISILSNAYLANALLSIGVLAAIFSIASGKVSTLPLALALILLSLIATGMNPNMVSFFLITLGSVLLAVEIFLLPGFGIVGISGIVLVLLGFALLPAYVPTGITPREDYILALRTFIIGSALILGTFFGIVLFKVIQVKRKKPISYTPIGKEGIAIDDIKPGEVGFVKVNGEYWRATSSVFIKAGERIVVNDMREDGVLFISKKE